MWLRALGVTTAVVAASALVDATERGRPDRGPARPPPATLQIPILIVCQTLLGQGARSGAWFCDVLASADPAQAPKVRLPPHRGVATVSFDLHNRHSFFAGSEGRVVRYAATVLVVRADGTLLSRELIQTDVRGEAAVVDRVLGGPGPDGVKLTAPVGRKAVRVMVPEGVTDLRVVGVRLTVDAAGTRDTFTTPGRPVAVISNASVSYTPSD